MTGWATTSLKQDMQIDESPILECPWGRQRRVQLTQALLTQGVALGSFSGALTGWADRSILQDCMLSLSHA